MPSKNQANGVGKGPRVLAKLGLILPIFAWLWFGAIYLVEPPWAAQSFVMVVLVQGCLLAIGGLLSILALALGTRGGARVIVPAVIGLVISGATVLLIGFWFVHQVLVQVSK
jgi:hypothetical protein